MSPCLLPPFTVFLKVRRGSAGAVKSVERRFSPSSLLQVWSWRSGAARTRPECSSWRICASWAWRHRLVFRETDGGGGVSLVRESRTCRVMMPPSFLLYGRSHSLVPALSTVLPRCIAPTPPVLPVAGPAPPSAYDVRRQVRGAGLGAGAGSARGGYAQGRDGWGEGVKGRGRHAQGKEEG